MADTIETFVEQLKTQGVDAGKAEGETLVSAAEAKAASIVADAMAQGEKTIAAAETKAASILQRAQTELQLASRDTLATLRSSLNDALTALLAKSTTAALNDAEFVKTLLGEVLGAYASADAATTGAVEINLTAEMKTALSDWLAGQCSSDTVRGELRAAGFEYEVDGAKVEVTTAAVVELLSSMVSPALRELLTTN
ncbi:MAG: hypothetical protein HN909_09040 [Phycisphaerales bacterium]|jgi:vacuolar-type H+-ATPase subunit H|nr:hypothetical protein [Phycisphaerales bacterium]MBT7171896.1 hypothetical protein [Phycisphaerales bacterium]